MNYNEEQIEAEIAKQKANMDASLAASLSKKDQEVRDIYANVFKEMEILKKHGYLTFFCMINQFNEKDGFFHNIVEDSPHNISAKKEDIIANRGKQFYLFGFILNLFSMYGCRVNHLIVADPIEKKYIHRVADLNMLHEAAEDYKNLQQ